MPRGLAVAFLLCASVLLSACATKPLESQAKVQDPREARIYFLRESTLIYSGTSPYLKVNGQEVGNVAVGSYFFVDRPAGTYLVSLDTPLTPGRFAANVTVRPGITYYLKVSPRMENLAISLTAGLVGTMIEASVQENSGPFSVTPLDQKTGAAMLAELKR